MKVYSEKQKPFKKFVTYKMMFDLPPSPYFFSRKALNKDSELGS